MRSTFFAMLALFLVAIFSFASASPAEAAVVANPDKSPFKATVNGGQLKVNTKLDLDVGSMNPAPTLENVTLDADGNLSAPASGLVFPVQVM